jgi:hypothetical protein
VRVTTIGSETWVSTLWMPMASLLRLGGRMREHHDSPFFCRVRIVPASGEPQQEPRESVDMDHGMSLGLEGGG